MKKGFTLIELLAVIVILSVIAIITTPMVLIVVEESRKKASIESVNGILDAAENYLIESIIMGKEETRFDFPNDSKLNYKGSKPESGTLLVDENGNMSITVLINGYCVRKNFKEKVPTIIEGQCEISLSELNEVYGYSEDILNGAKPALGDDLIPVIIASDGTVTYADITSTWYSYENKIWANAIILVDTPSKEYKTGDLILESDIKQYYVWIPRYKYQLWNVNSESLYPNKTIDESAINIVFEDKDTPVSNGDKNGEWLTHPAFTSFNTNGIWVGKFEVSYNEETYTNNNLFVTVNPNYNSVITGNNIIIKPNVRSLTNKSISEFYILGREINKNLNSHMMKNMEWGATAYLTYSIYGKCTENGCEEVTLNNVNTGYLPASSSTFAGQWSRGGTITGCSASGVSSSIMGNKTKCEDTYAWNEINNKASTTGNISGIYDMNGGNSEAVMSTIKDISGNPLSGRSDLYNSGFNGIYGCPTCDSQTLIEKTNGIVFPNDNKYYDLYEPNSYELGDTSAWYDYKNSHLGDAIKEIALSGDYSNDKGIWYNDFAYFPTFSLPWFVRGGNMRDGSGAGILYFARSYGCNEAHTSFRVVLAY